MSIQIDVHYNSQAGIPSQQDSPLTSGDNNCLTAIPQKVTVRCVIKRIQQAPPLTGTLAGILQSSYFYRVLSLLA